ncbi:MAG: L-lactate permease [Chloroflexi bacterium]|nr:L-lactate permease [Chloroflexota bacterium]
MPGTFGRSGGGEAAPAREVLLALAGYAILVALTLAFQLIPAVKDFVGQVRLAVQFPEIRTALGYVTPAEAGRKINVFGHAGAILLYSSVLSYLIYRRAGRYREGAAGRIVTGTLKGVVPSSLGIVGMVSMAVVMSHAGMTETLARGLASGVGAAFPAMSPFIGALGAFMTGSNTNSNVVFAMLQLRTAQLLGLSVPIILAAQTTGAAMGAMLSPTKIVVGASTAGLGGKEGLVLRALLPYGVLLVLQVSALAWVMTR